MFGLFQSEEEKAKERKLEAIQNVKQDEKYRKPTPLGNHVYPELGSMNFKVTQKSQEITLFTYRYPAKGESKAVLIIFHGLNSHVGKSAHIAAQVAEIGVDVVGFDYRGFGRSEGIRGYFESQESLESDVEQFEKIVRQKFPNKPIFLSGQSWGGQVAFTFAVKYPQRYKGLVLFAPALKDNEGNAKYGKKLAKIIGAICPTLELVASKPGLASKNPQVDADFMADPYSYSGRLIPGTIRNLLNHQEVCSSQFHLLKTPFLVIMGGVEKLVDPDIGSELMKQCTDVQDKEYLFYENLWHNIWGEEEIHDIIPKVAAWIQKRI